MAEPRFQKLRESLRQAGISKRNARRAAAEIEDHFVQLVGEALARGEKAPDAQRHAHEMLGSDEILIKRYASRPELLAWAGRWPAVWFTLVPLGCYLGLAIGVMGLFVLGLHQQSTHLHAVKVAPPVSRLIELAARLLFLALMPIVTAAAFGIWAQRRRIPLRWPLTGIAMVSILASLINLEFTITGGPSPGYAGAGIGVSVQSLPAQMLRALAVGALAAMPLWIAARRAKRSRGHEMI
jgi:hypothetical protein